MTSLDFVIVHDYPEKYWLVLKSNRIGLAAEIVGISKPHVHETSESSLGSRTMGQEQFPEGAILYVHGNVNTGYNNVGYVREFSQERLDLRFVLQIDPFFSSKRHFWKERNYLYAKELLSQTPHASQPVICQYDLRFFAPERDDAYWLATYLQELKQLRGL